MIHSVCAPFIPKPGAMPCAGNFSKFSGAPHSWFDVFRLIRRVYIPGFVAHAPVLKPKVHWTLSNIKIEKWGHKKNSISETD